MLAVATGYLLDAVEQVGPAHLAAPTPCARWTVRELLAHLGDSTAALLDAVDGEVPLEPVPGGPVAEQAQRLLAALDRPRRPIRIGDRVLRHDLFVAAAALELAVHGWDLNTAMHRPHPIPETLAQQLIDANAPTGPPEFGPPTTPPPSASPAQRLLASLGRNCHVPC
jgi:uncharacterized protein (TIGR03086 family)